MEQNALINETITLYNNINNLKKETDNIYKEKLPVNDYKYICNVYDSIFNIYLRTITDSYTYNTFAYDTIKANILTIMDSLYYKRNKCKTGSAEYIELNSYYDVIEEFFVNISK